jgi:integrase
VIGNRSVRDIKRREVIEIIERITDRGSPVMANRVLATMRKFFNWCVNRGILEVSPLAGISPPTRERSRERVLSDKEIANVLAAAQSTPYPFGPIVLLLFLTAQRREEVGGMRWNEIDLKQKIWTIPAERIKNAKGHQVHLSDLAISILNSLPRFVNADGTPSDLVFTSTGKTAFSGYSRAKGIMDKRSGVIDWRLHDIRRTVATELARLGAAVHVVEAILNHRSGVISGVAAVYQRHDFLEERKTALSNWSDQIRERLEVTTH